VQEEVQVYEDPFVGEEPDVLTQEMDKPVLEELPLNEQSIERRQSDGSSPSDTVMGETTEEQNRGHHKTTSTGSVMQAESTEPPRAEVLKNRQLLASGINKIRSRTVEAHMFRRLQDMIKSAQDIWGADDEKFAELLLASLEYLEAPADTLKAPPAKTANLKVQALATIRAMLSLYRKETAKYFSRVLCTILQTKAQYENTSHIATDLEATADEIVKYGQTSDCLNAVLSLLEDSSSTSPGTSSPAPSTAAPSNNRTKVMALGILASLIQISAQKNVTLSADQTAKLGKLAVHCLDDVDADVRKADVEVCLALHERIGEEKEAFWKVVAGAREQHLNLLTYYLAKRGRA
jgi:CLIP-associating protein 1/2